MAFKIVSFWRVFFANNLSKLGVITMLILLIGNITFFLYEDKIFAWEPYSDVRVTKVVVKEQNTVLIQANFVKNTCVFNRLDVVGVALGSTIPLQWKDMDGLEPTHDREQGTQSLNILVYLRGVVYDSLEIRTRHLCGSEDEIVDRTFTTVDLDAYHEHI